MGKMDEQIIVVPREKLFENETLTFNWNNSDKKIVEKIFKNIFNNFSIMRRWDAEENPNFKQPIPYLIVRKWEEIYLYERLTEWWENRLHNKLSIWVWWHMNKTNHETFDEILNDNLTRELEEELDIKATKKELKTIWLINDDNNEVWKVHIWILLILDLDLKARVEVKETDQLLWRWISIEELKKEKIYSRLESWSQIASNIL